MPTPIWSVASAMFVLGMGMRCGWETLALIVQNSSPTGRVGVATSTSTVLREAGVAIGLAVVGSMFTARLAQRLPAGLDPALFTTSGLAALPADQRSLVVTARHDAL